MVQFSDALLDQLYAPGISQFSAVEIPDLSSEGTEHEHWLQNMFLNSIFGPRYTPTMRQTATTFIFRTQISLRNYEMARRKTLACVEAFRPGRPDSRSYFEALSFWESVVLNIQIALNIIELAFDLQDLNGPGEVALRQIANRIKHYAEDVADKKNPNNLTVPMWLEKQGLVTRTARISFGCLADIVREMVKAADILQLPDGPPPIDAPPAKN